MFSNEKFGINSEMDKTISNFNFSPVKKSKESENNNITKLIDTNIQKMSIKTDRKNENNLYHVNNKEMHRDQTKGKFLIMNFPFCYRINIFIFNRIK